MPRILTASFSRAGQENPVIEVQIEWSEIERVTPYLIRFEFWEQDSGWRGGDDFLNHVIDRPISGSPTAPRARIETGNYSVSPQASWNQEVGNDEVYVVIRLWPHPDADVPRNTTTRTNIISARF